MSDNDSDSKVKVEKKIEYVVRMTEEEALDVRAFLGACSWTSPLYLELCEAFEKELGPLSPKIQVFRENG